MHSAFTQTAGAQTAQIPTDAERSLFNEYLVVFSYYLLPAAFFFFCYWQAKEEFNNIQLELAGLSTKFSNNVLDATKAFSLTLEDKADVEGLPASALGLAAQSAKVLILVLLLVHVAVCFVPWTGRIL